MSSGCLPNIAKLEMKALIRMYLLSCGLARGSTNRELSVLKTEHRCHASREQGCKRRVGAMSCLAVTVKSDLFIHCNILCLIFFLPEWCVYRWAEPRKHNSLPCYVMLTVIGEHFFSLLDLYLRFCLPPVRDSQVQIKEGKGEILSEELPLEVSKSYNTCNT